MNECKGSLTRAKSENCFWAILEEKRCIFEQDCSKCQKKESNSLKVWTSNNHLHPFRFFSKIWGTLHVANFK